MNSDAKGSLSVSTRDVPSVSSDDIDTNAWLVWETIRVTDSFRHARARKHNNLPGKLWTGSVNAVINKLWPALTDRYLVDREREQEIKLALNRYLRNGLAVVCISDGGLHRASTWWISDRWAPVTVTRQQSDVITDDVAAAGNVVETRDVTDDADVFNVTADNVSDVDLGGKEKSAVKKTPGDETYECRDAKCDRKFTGANHRAVHERSHGFRVNHDGSVTTFSPADADRPRSDEISQAVVTAMLSFNDEKPTMNDVIEVMRTTDPRISKEMARVSIISLHAKPWNGYSLMRISNQISGKKGHTTRYLLEKVASDDEVNVTPSSTSMPVKKTGDVNVDLTAHVASLEALLQDLQRLSSLEKRLAEEILRNETLTRDLEEVTDQRDELRDRLTQLKRLFDVNLDD